MDQAGHWLEWDGSDADCEARLIHRVEKGKAAEITYPDSVAFDLAGS